MVYNVVDWPTFLDFKFKATLVCMVNFSEYVGSVLLVNEREIALLDQKLFVPLFRFQRSAECLRCHGDNITGCWNPVTNSVLLVTASGLVLSLKLDSLTSLTTPFSEINPSLCSTKAVEFVNLGNFPTAVCFYENLLFLASANGSIEIFQSDGQRLFGHAVNRISFFQDAEHTRVRRVSDSNLLCQTLTAAPTLGGVIGILSSYEVALFRICGKNLSDLSVDGILFEHLDCPVVAAVNHRFRIVAVGCANSEVALYRVDESTGAIFILDRLRISNRECPDAAGLVGSVTCMTWSPDGYALAVAWSNCGWALWSTFGGLLHTSLGERVGLSNQVKLTHLTWSTSGYQLFAFLSFASSGFLSNTGCEQTDGPDPHLVVFQLARSALTMNPTSDNHQHVILQSDDRLFFMARNQLDASRTPQCVRLPIVYMRQNWPLRYVSVNSVGDRIAVSGTHGLAHFNCKTKRWQMFGNEVQERSMEIYGGLVWWKHFICFVCLVRSQAIYEIRTYPCDEKLDERFSSVCRFPQNDQPLLVDCVDDRLTSVISTGRVYVFRLGHKDEDKNKNRVQIIPLQIIDLNNLILFPQCIVRLCFSPLMTNLPLPINTTASRKVEHPTTPPGPYNAGSTASSDLLSPLCEQRPQPLLINYAGHLFMLQPNLTKDSPSSGEDNLDSIKKPLMLTPFLIAYNVELVWVTYGLLPQCPNYPTADSLSHSGGPGLMPHDLLLSYLRESMWLYCGAHGLQIWLPLPKLHNLSPPGFDASTDPSWFTDPVAATHIQHKISLGRTLLSPAYSTRRIMLSVELDECMHPLAILFDQAVLVGVSNEFHRPFRSLLPADDPITVDQFYSVLPFGVLNLETHAFLHRVIQQLLRKNLAAHALQLATAYQNLPHFHRLLEWLLHEVLELEATAKSPIPDPLLPQVVAFIQEFPFFLDTLAQCARKTEVARWPHLFTAVGRRPRDLFELCLDYGNLDAAASYLIILQSSEPAQISQECTLHLIELTLNAAKWDLLRELIRFLNAIDPGDLSCSPSSVSSPPTLERHQTLNFPTSTLSPVAIGPSHISPKFTKEKRRISSPQKCSASGMLDISPKSNATSLAARIQQLVRIKARNLYTHGKLREMAELHANFPRSNKKPDIHHTANGTLATWIASQRAESHRVANWPSGLCLLRNSFFNSTFSRDHDTQAHIQREPLYLHSSNSPPATSDPSNPTLRQLRYLFNQLLVAGSFEWASLVAILCKDRVGLLRVITSCVELTIGNNEDKHNLKPASDVDCGYGLTVPCSHETEQAVLGDYPIVHVCSLHRILTGLETLDAWAIENDPPSHEFISSVQPNLSQLIDQTASLHLDDSSHTNPQEKQSTPIDSCKQPQEQPHSFIYTPVTTERTEFVQLTSCPSHISYSESSGLSPESTPPFSTSNRRYSVRDKTDRSSVFAFLNSQDDLLNVGKLTLFAPSVSAPCSLGSKTDHSFFIPDLPRTLPGYAGYDCADVLTNTTTIEATEHVVDGTVEIPRVHVTTSEPSSGCTLS